MERGLDAVGAFRGRDPAEFGSAGEKILKPICLSSDHRNVTHQVLGSVWSVWLRIRAMRQTPQPELV